MKTKNEIPKVVVIQVKMLAIVVCTDLPANTKEDREEIARLTNIVNLCGTSLGWVFPNDNRWYQYTKENPFLRVGSSNGVLCDNYPKTHKHYILFA